MGARTKCYSMTPLLADELRAAQFKHYMRDGELDAEEVHLLNLSDGVCLQSELVEQRVKSAVRILGGGQVDRGIIASIRSLLSEALRLMGGKTKSPERREPYEASERQAA